MEIENKLREIISGIDDSVDAAALTRETKLKDEMGMSSISLLYMAVAIEDEFGVNFSNANLGELETIGDVIDAIEKLRQA